MNIIETKQKELSQHPVYDILHTVEGIRHFMEYHVFAVWDFMSLLKALQIRLTCVELPWRPSPYPTEMVRLINQIVLGEESDLDPQGHPVSHFELYLRGMEEVGANTETIRRFLESQDFLLIPTGAREFVQDNIDLAKDGHIVEVASTFFFGREKLIPEIFQTIVNTLKKSSVHAPLFLFYLERHIEVDSGEHGPLAMKALTYLTKDSAELKDLAVSSGIKALQKRKVLWDKVLESYSK